MRTKEIEVQWNMARYEQQKKAAEAEINRSRQLNNQVITLTKTENDLRNQLSAYAEKYKQVCILFNSVVRPTQALTDNEVEHSLNNSNELYLTFRKEVEEMSKRTKKLERDNEAYRRKDSALNQNILKMAEERNKHLKELEDTKKKNQKLTSIINQMQQQGRGIPSGMQGAVQSGYGEATDADEGDIEGEGDSECDYDEEEEEEQISEGDFDDDTEEDIPNVPGAYGPERPPAMNGHR